LSDIGFGTRLAEARVEVMTMNRNNINDPDINDPDELPRKDPDEREEFVPGPLDEPAEADDSNEPLEDFDDDEDSDIEEEID
jgi:hypothetical protein